MGRIGAHASVAGGLPNAVTKQIEYDGTCGQIFTHSPRVWKTRAIPSEELAEFRSETDTHDIGPWVIHASYLVNLSTPRSELRTKSIEAMQYELNVAAECDIPFVNVHLGAHTGAGVEEGLSNATSAINELDVPSGVTILLETDAGSGTKLGDTFSHLQTVIENCSHDLGVCLDTAHVFAAGYDISTAAGVDALFEEFDAVVGRSRLRFVHLNDSKHACGTNKDEHAHIGEGKIGVDGMTAFLTHEVTADLPLVLETPTENGKSFAWNIQRVRDLRA